VYAAVRSGDASWTACATALVWFVCSGLDDTDKELLENNRLERNHIEDEIRELRERNVSIYVATIRHVWLLHTMKQGILSIARLTSAAMTSSAEYSAESAEGAIVAEDLSIGKPLVFSDRPNKRMYVI